MFRDFWAGILENQMKFLKNTIFFLNILLYSHICYLYLFHCKYTIILVRHTMPNEGTVAKSVKGDCTASFFLVEKAWLPELEHQPVAPETEYGKHQTDQLPSLCKIRLLQPNWKKKLASLRGSALEILVLTWVRTQNSWKINIYLIH